MMRKKTHVSYMGMGSQPCTRSVHINNNRADLWMFIPLNIAFVGGSMTIISAALVNSHSYGKKNSIFNG